MSPDHVTSYLIMTVSGQGPLTGSLLCVHCGVYCVIECTLSLPRMNVAFQFVSMCVCWCLHVTDKALLFLLSEGDNCCMSRSAVPWWCRLLWIKVYSCLSEYLSGRPCRSDGKVHICLQGWVWMLGSFSLSLPTHTLCKTWDDHRELLFLGLITVLHFSRDLTLPFFSTRWKEVTDYEYFGLILENVKALHGCSFDSLKPIVVVFKGRTSSCLLYMVWGGDPCVALPRLRLGDEQPLGAAYRSPLPVSNDLSVLQTSRIHSLPRCGWAILHPHIPKKTSRKYLDAVHWHSYINVITVSWALCNPSRKQETLSENSDLHHIWNHRLYIYLDRGPPLAPPVLVKDASILLWWCHCSCILHSSRGIEPCYQGPAKLNHKRLG